MKWKSQCFVIEVVVIIVNSLYSLLYLEVMHTTATLGYFHPVELVDGVDPKRSLTGTTMAIGLFSPYYYTKEERQEHFQIGDLYVWYKQCHTPPDFSL